jgi:Acetyltransferase (GNAT) domain
MAGAERIAPRFAGKGLDIEWSSNWGPQHDRMLDDLAFLDDDDRQLHRLLGRTTDATKVHATVAADGAPIAVVSLRRRPGFWEPASAQCLPGTPIACVPDQLGRVLRGLGREVRIGSLYRDPSDLHPLVTRSYQRYGADLRGDYEAHWPHRGGMNYLAARKKTVGFDVRIDHPGDLEWTVNRWAEFWRDNETGEVASAPDRLAVWGHLQGVRTHSVMLAKDDQPVAGCVHFCVDGVVKFECTGRDLAFEKQRVGTRVLDVSFEWAKQAGYDIFDMGGGADYKHWWAPPYATSYEAVFVPPLVQRVNRFAHRARSLASRGR